MTIYAKKMELIEKYKDVLALISKAEEADGHKEDRGVCFDMLLENYESIQAGEEPKFKGVPADFNYEEFGKDCAGLKRK